jgi:hypothetical protein
MRLEEPAGISGESPVRKHADRRASAVTGLAWASLASSQDRSCWPIATSFRSRPARVGRSAAVQPWEAQRSSVEVSRGCPTSTLVVASPGLTCVNVAEGRWSRVIA